MSWKVYLMTGSAAGRAVISNVLVPDDTGKIVGRVAAEVARDLCMK